MNKIENLKNKISNIFKPKTKVHYCKELPMVCEGKTECGTDIVEGLYFSIDTERVNCKKCLRKLKT